MTLRILPYLTMVFCLILSPFVLGALCFAWLTWKWGFWR